MKTLMFALLMLLSVSVQAEVIEMPAVDMRSNLTDSGEQVIVIAVPEGIAYDREVDELTLLPNGVRVSGEMVSSVWAEVDKDRLMQFAQHQTGTKFYMTGWALVIVFLVSALIGVAGFIWGLLAVRKVQEERRDQWIKEHGIPPVDVHC